MTEDLGGGHTENISFSSVAPVNVQVRDVTVEVTIHGGKKKVDVEAEGNSRGVKRILDGISADFPSGTLCGIMGGSGSGKTTLLNLMAHRTRLLNNASGSILYNGSPSLLSITHAYLTQMDLLLPTLTVRETLLYAASLRLSSEVTAAQRKQLVEEVILELGLKECADTRVGNGLTHGGCSGGERRRVSIGVQMLSNPSVLFCDEPTTGLDATSAFQLVSTLKSLASKGRTIICTIHQPRHDIFYLFDNMLLLSKGLPLYSGPTHDSTMWFENLVPGSFSEHVNPADYLIMVAAVDTRTSQAKAATSARLVELAKQWKSESSIRFFSKEKDTSDSVSIRSPAPVARTAPTLRQIRVLTSRNILMTWRDPMGMTASWVEAILMSIVCGLIYYNLGEDLAGIRSRQSALYSAGALQGYLVVMYETWRMTSGEIAVFDRERGEGIISVIPWMISRRLAQGLLEDIFVPFVFSIIIWFMCGFDTDGVRFFKFFAVILLNQFIAKSFATVATSVSRDFALATLVGNISFTVFTFSAGFFIQADSIPVYLRWTKWISYCFYSFAALTANELTGRFYDCPSGDAATDPNCLPYRGDFILQNLSFNPGWYTVPTCALLGFITVFTLVAGLLLHFKKVDVHMAGVHTGKSSDDDDTIAITPSKSESASNSMTGVDLELVDVKLALRKLNLKLGVRPQTTEKQILRGVTTRFQSGQVNVIMGPSGSGKSSLLNLLSSRLPSSTGYFTTSGQLMIDGFPAEPEDLQALCSYVTQDDSALLSYLTVREMLRFAAGLRLPKSMSRKEKRRRAEEVIRAMGLSDCADNLIGSEFVKGISGGEKRRVSIGVQLLTEPRILIADEPTSGLDAFTASSILEVLTNLAKEGRTVIITIHQSRSELFTQFGNLLLLAKGGRVAYSGKASEMISHFNTLGYECPRNANPSDWALDLISVDLRNSAAEEKSRKKVEKILEAYAKGASQVEPGESKEGTGVDLVGLRKQMTPFYIAFPILVQRGWISLRRKPDIPIARVTQTLGLGLVSALWFAPLGRDYVDATVNVVGVIQEILPLYFVGMLQNAAAYPSERDVFYKEYTDRAYSLESFFLSYMFYELPFEIFASLLFSLVGCIGVNLSRTVPMYFIVSLNAFCIVNAGESLGIIFNTLFADNGGLALNITSIVLSVGQFMAGLMSLNMLGLLRGINYISPLKYAAANIMVYALREMEFTCDDSQRLPDGTCPFNTGEDLLRLYKYEHTNPGHMLAVLVGTTVIYRLVAYLILKISLVRWKLRR